MERPSEQKVDDKDPLTDRLKLVGVILVITIGVAMMAFIDALWWPIKKVIKLCK